MTCSGRYAEVWEFAKYFCTESLIMGVDNSGGAGNAFLTDTLVEDFRDKGVYAGQGMILENVTQGTEGPVTAMTATTLTATGVTWDNADRYRIAALTASQRLVIEDHLLQAASDIHAARAANGGCDCNLASWAAEYLARLNSVIAAAFYDCLCTSPGPPMIEERRQMYMDWSTEQLRMLREGDMELCDGETGKNFPATDWAEQGTTEFARTGIVVNDALKNS